MDSVHPQLAPMANQPPPPPQGTGSISAEALLLLLRRGTLRLGRGQLLLGSAKHTRSSQGELPSDPLLKVQLSVA